MRKNITSIVVDKVYPRIKASLDRNTPALKKCIGKFITDRYDQLYDTGLTYRIYFGQSDLDDFFKAIKIPEVEINNMTADCFWHDMDGFNPPCAKEAFTIAMICAIRYYLMKNDSKSAEICTIYLAFSGSFYASVHGKMFKKFPPKKECMDYVVNYKLTDTFSLKQEGTLFGAIRALCITWINTYKSLMKSKTFTDSDHGDVVQQLRDRESSFVRNIAKIYYECYENGEYFNYESEKIDTDGDDYRLSDNDALKISNYTEQVVNHVTQKSIDYGICKSCADQNVSASEVQFIMESILNEKEYLGDIRKVVNIIITDFHVNRPNSKISSIDFISYSMTLKPNTKNKQLLEMKAIILKWLTEKSPNYVRRKGRPDTANSYYKCVLYYFVLLINKVVRS